MTTREVTAIEGNMAATPQHQMLIDWLTEELGRRNLSQSEAARRAGLSPNSINQIINGVPPGLRACIALAQYFNEPLTRVLYMAGHISKEEMEGRDRFSERFMPLFEKLTPEQKDSIMALLRSIVGDLQ
jgi:transcriptional regulator with XRE-family HTH domain